MPNRPSKVFSFTEVNQLVPKVADLTEQVIHELDNIRRRSRPDAESGSSSISDAVLKEVEEALQGWSEGVIELGGNPKGYFTVDFQSIDPELLYCWNYGEDKICYTHKVWENFSHRRPLTESIDASGEHLKWVN
ncbi:MAG: DUF2203 domain-containing protein [Acidobacteriia bacterium]|nr:DUF2203 domain-containing protein [Terriglobia bacterium]